jgi:magnesium transporter
VSLKEIILSKPNQTLKEIMTAEVISVPLEMDQEQVSKVVERYDFLSIPVVDDKNILKGVITVDDIIDVIREEAQDNLISLGAMIQSDDETLRGRLISRIPWSLVSFAGGLVCYYFIWSLFYDKSTALSTSVSAFFPISLALGATLGIQSAFSVVSLLLSEQSETKKIRKLISQEFISALIFGVIFGTLSVGLAFLARESLIVALFMGTSLFLQILFSVFAGSMLPLAMKRIGGDPAVASVSLFLALSNIFAVIITYGLAYKFL